MLRSEQSVLRKLKEFLMNEYNEKEEESELRSAVD